MKLTFMLAFLVVNAVSSCKERVPSPPPNVVADPLLKGTCWRTVEHYHENGYWDGYDMCQYEGYWWRCGSGEHRVCTREAQLPAEQEGMVRK